MDTNMVSRLNLDFWDYLYGSILLFEMGIIMTPEPQPEESYIITESELAELEDFASAGYKTQALIIGSNIRDCPHSSAQESSDKVLELLNDLRHYANGEYKEADVSDDEDKMRIHLEYENRIWGIMKELRHSSKGSGDRK